MVAMVAFFIIVVFLLGECWKIPGHEDSSVLLEKGSWVLTGKFIRSEPVVQGSFVKSYFHLC
jgi:hypothetical protein